MDTVDAIETAYDQTASLVASLDPTALAASTACTDWDVRSVLNHLLGATWMFTLVNQGRAAGEEAGDVVGDDLDEAVAAARKANLDSWRRPDAFQGDRTYPFGTFPAAAAAMVNLEEVVVHSWDIATATGQGLTLDDSVTAMVYEFCRSIPLDDFRAHGAFGPEVKVDVSAPITDRLVGLLGRRP